MARPAPLAQANGGAMAYRKRESNDTWHFCKNCSNWPTTQPYKEQDAKPTTGEFCNECLAKDRNGDCKK